MSNNVKSGDLITVTGKMRLALAEAMLKVGRGELPQQDGRNMIGLANQITQSIAVEIKHQMVQKSLGVEVTTLGMLNIGDEQ